MAYEVDQHFGGAIPQRSSKSEPVAAAGKSTLTEQLPSRGQQLPSAPPQTPEFEDWHSDSLLRRSENVVLSMVPDLDNLTEVPGEIVAFIRTHAIALGTSLAIAAVPFVLAAAPASGITAIVAAIAAFLYKVGVPVLDVAQRLNIIIHVKRWLRLAWNANTPADIKQANAEFMALVVAIAWLVLRIKSKSNEGTLAMSRDQMLVPVTQSKAITGSLAESAVAKASGSLSIGQTVGAIEDSGLYIEGVRVPAFAGGSPKLDQLAKQVDHERQLSPVALARRNEQNPKIRKQFDRLIAYFHKHEIDAKDGAVYERTMEEAFYGRDELGEPYEDVQMAEIHTDVSEFMSELEAMETELELRVRRKAGMMGTNPRERATWGPPNSLSSYGRAKEGLELIREVRKQGRMSLAEYHRICEAYHFAFGYGPQSTRLTAMFDAFWRKPFQPILERRREQSLRQRNDMSPIYVGLIERLQRKQFKKDGLQKRDLRQHRLHDENHYIARAEMPENAEAFLNEVMPQIDFYEGFEQLRDQRSEKDQNLLDIIWAEIYDENFSVRIRAQDFEFHLRLDPGGNDAIAAVIFQKLQPGREYYDRRYSYSEGDVLSATKLLREYAQRGLRPRK